MKVENVWKWRMCGSGEEWAHNVTEVVRAYATLDLLHASLVDDLCKLTLHMWEGEGGGGEERAYY